MDLLRRQRLGDSFRLIAVNPACPISGLLTHLRRYRQYLGVPQTPFPAPGFLTDVKPSARDLAPIGRLQNGGVLKKQTLRVLVVYRRYGCRPPGALRPGPLWGERTRTESWGLTA